MGQNAPRPLPSGSVLREALEGLRYVVAHPTLRGIALYYSLYQVGYGAFFVALPVLILERFSGGGLVVGALWGALGAAGVASSFGCGGIGTAGRERLMMTGGMLASGPLLEASLALGLVFAAAACAVVGLLAYVTVG